MPSIARWSWKLLKFLTDGMGRRTANSFRTCRALRNTKHTQTSSYRLSRVTLEYMSNSHGNSPSRDRFVSGALLFFSCQDQINICLSYLQHNSGLTPGGSNVLGTRESHIHMSDYVSVGTREQDREQIAFYKPMLADDVSSYKNVSEVWKSQKTA